VTGRPRHRFFAAAGPLAAAGAVAVSPAAAHGFGQRYDLPIPLAHYIWGAGATVALSFVLLALFLRAGRADTGPTLTLSLRGAERALGIAATAVRIAAVALLLLAIVAGFFGDQNPFRNIAPTLVWIIGWVGIAFFSFVLGDVWRLLNPWAALYDAVAGIFPLHLNTEPPNAFCRYPPWLGAWPAVILFVVFAWMELAWSGRSVPADLAVALALYSVLTLAGLSLFGRAWLDRGEIFSKVFGLFARFAPVAWPSGRSAIVLRLPGVGLLDAQPLDWAQVALTIAVLATVTFDGLLETPLWARLDAAILDAPDDSVLWTSLGLREDQALRLVRTVALPAIVLLFIVAYVAVCWSMAALARDKAASTAMIARRFVLTLVPIAIAYHVAHYFSYLFVGGQSVIPLISDPFGWGWNLFGTAAYRPDIGMIGPRLQWYVAVVSVVVGHVIAVCLSHIVGLRLFADRRTALVTQVPMIVLMIAYTMCSLWILSQPIVESPAG